jgi:hypothetical protein
MKSYNYINFYLCLLLVNINKKTWLQDNNFYFSLLLAKNMALEEGFACIQLCMYGGYLMDLICNILIHFQRYDFLSMIVC